MVEKYEDKRNLLEKAKDAAKDWYYKHEVTIKKVGQATISTIVLIGPIVGPKAIKAISNAHQKKIKESRIYDPRAGYYIHARRRLTNKDKLNITRMSRDTDRSYIEIMNDMNLL